jgi:hypothetical protein
MTALSGVRPSSLLLVARGGLGAISTHAEVCNG